MGGKFHVFYLRVLYVHFVSVDGASSIYIFIHSLFIHIFSIYSRL